MNRNQISSTITCAAPELRSAGLSALYLFGSQARGDASDESDIDFAFDVAEGADERFSVIDQARLQLRLEAILGCKVDFLERRGLRSRMREQVEREMVRLM